MLSNIVIPAVSWRESRKIETWMPTDDFGHDKKIVRSFGFKKFWVLGCESFEFCVMGRRFLNNVKTDA